jgi:hypothetical protein
MGTVRLHRRRVSLSAGHPGALARPVAAAVRDLCSESVVLVLAGSLLLLAMTQPAFGAFFVGEDFEYLGSYRAQGSDFWRAVASPHDTYFFRPVFGAAALPWHFLLPPDPWAYHVRNLAFSALNLLLLHRVLLRLVASRAARGLALLLFAVSKVHLTTIGYITIYDSVISLTLLLATVLCFLRYIAHRHTLDYGLGLLFCCLSIGTKDYGLVIVGVVLALVVSRGAAPGPWRRRSRWWALRLAPVAAMALVYLWWRHAIVGLLPSSQPVYTPEVSFELIARKLVLFASAMANLSLNWANLPLADRQAIGGGSLADWLAVSRLRLGAYAPWLEPASCVLLAAVALRTLALGRGAGRALLLPLAWLGLYLGPTLLVRNVQLYYVYEPLAGAAVLLGVCMDRVGRRLLGIWGLVLVLIGVNGAISNYNSSYHWQAAASAAQQVAAPVLAAHRGEPLDSITFMTARQGFWRWVLTADSKGPMLPVLLGRPTLQVRFIGYEGLPGGQAVADPANLFVDIDNGFSTLGPDAARPALFLKEIWPGQARAGTGFNVQPDGSSALAIAAEHATPGTVVVMDGRRLATTYGGPAFLTALVPAELLASPGTHWVYLSNGASESTRVEFVVSAEEPAQPAVAARGLAIESVPGRPVLRRLRPSSTPAGRPFNVQPDGESALAIECEDARPDTVIVFDGTSLSTTYGNEGWLTAFMPGNLYSRPGRYEVYLKTGLVESDRLEFVVQP